MDMKIKEIINSYPNKSAQEIIDTVHKFDVVSFDIFDTLLKRNVKSESDVFRFVERMYESKYSTNMPNFLDVRRKAEECVRNKNIEREVSIDEIYSSVHDLYLKNEDVISIEDIENLKQMEYEAEKILCVKNEIIYEVFQYCKAKKKKIILISDMYFSQEFIEGLLEKNQIIGYHSIYISSESGFRKRTKGKLFEYVKDMEQITKNKWIHIGDGKRSDYLEARRVGIATCNIAKNDVNTKYIQRTQRNDLDASILVSYINNTINECDNQNIRLGYEVYGPLLYFFTKWLQKNLNKEDTILFFSRDSYLVKKAYEELSGKKESNKYFLASRKSLLLPALKNDSSIERVSILIKSEPVRMTMSGFLAKFNLEANDFKELLNKYGLLPETVILRDKLQEKIEFLKFYRDIEPYIRKKAEEAYNNFQRYFETLKCTSNIQVVDIGWRCTMQACLQDFMKEYRWMGYYLGIRENANVKVNSEAKGFFLNGEKDEDKKCFLASMTALLEIFFSAPHGSVVHYAANGEAACDDYECKDDMIYSSFLTEIHEGAMAFVKNFNNNPISKYLNVYADNMFIGLEILGKKPLKRELELIGDYPFQMGIGVVPVAAPQRIWKYFVKPSRLLYDFSNSNWKVAFLRRLFKVKMPYYKIFSWIYKHKTI